MSIFDTMIVRKQKRSTFNRSHTNLLTTQMGKLVPFYVDEILPGDSINLKCDFFTRMMPMLAPIMHEVDIYTHFFFVPNRIIWNKWKDFISGNGEAPVKPKLLYNSIQQGQLLTPSSLADYLGFPVNPRVNTLNERKLDAMPFMAYQMIYNEYYRDENLEEPIEIYSDKEGDLPASALLNLNTLRTRAWQKDYFTSALPWAQKGPEITLPLHDTNVKLDLSKMADPGGTAPGNPSFKNPNGDAPQQGDLYTSSEGNIMSSQQGGQIPLTYDPAGTLVAETSQVAPTINEVRRNFLLQRFAELDARGGNRLKETIYSHFGVLIKDATLQRPQYLGGGKTPLVISEVLQHSQTQNTPLGEMGGHGVSLGTTHKIKHFFDEHGFIMGIMSIVPKAMYFQGVPKMYLRENRFEYYWPEFQGMGEQAIEEQELFFVNVPDADKATFGYTPRFSDYKYKASGLHGDFLDSLDFWHMARIFYDRPGLNNDFIKVNPIDRPFAVQDEQYDKYLVQIYLDLKHKRAMHKHSIPGLNHM